MGTTRNSNDEIVNIQLQKRSVVGTGINSLRVVDYIIPGSVYGQKFDSINVQTDRANLKKIQKLSTSEVVDIDVDGTKIKCVLKDLQLNPINDDVLSFSFMKVDEDTLIKVEVAIKVNGESLAVKNNIGFLVTPISHIPVRSKLKSLPKFYEVNISNLNNIGDSIFVKDIVLGEGVSLAPGFDEYGLVATIVPPQKEERNETTTAVTDTTTAVPTEGSEKAEVTSENKE